MTRLVSHLALTVMVCATIVFAEVGAPAFAQAQPTAPAKSARFDASACLACHTPIKSLHTSGKHKDVGCNACHDRIAEHVADSSKRPVTKTDLATCGGCHQNQYKSYAQMDWQRGARSEKKLTTGPAPTRRTTC